MGQIWYRTARWTFEAEIAAYEIHRATETRMYWLTGRKKKSGKPEMQWEGRGANWHPNYEAARRYLLMRAEQRVKDAKWELKRAEEDLARVSKMPLSAPADVLQALPPTTPVGPSVQTEKTV